MGPHGQIRPYDSGTSSEGYIIVFISIIATISIGIIIVIMRCGESRCTVMRPSTDDHSGDD